MEMLHPEIKYLYTFAMFFEKAKSAKIRIQERCVILHVLHLLNVLIMVAYWNC